MASCLMESSIKNEHVILHGKRAFQSVYSLQTIMPKEVNIAEKVCTGSLLDSIAIVSPDLTSALVQKMIANHYAIPANYFNVSYVAVNGSDISQDNVDQEKLLMKLIALSASQPKLSIKVYPVVFGS